MQLTYWKRDNKMYKYYLADFFQIWYSLEDNYIHKEQPVSGAVTIC